MRQIDLNLSASNLRAFLTRNPCQLFQSILYLSDGGSHCVRASRSTQRVENHHQQQQQLGLSGSRQDSSSSGVGVSASALLRVIVYALLALKCLTLASCCFSLVLLQLLNCCWQQPTGSASADCHQSSDEPIADNNKNRNNSNNNKTQQQVHAHICSCRSFTTAASLHTLHYGTRCCREFGKLVLFDCSLTLVFTAERPRRGTDSS
jgi:hypothetical protein